MTVPTRSPIPALKATPAPDMDLSVPIASVLLDRYRSLDTHALLVALREGIYFNRIALVSSFGAESAVLLHLISRVDVDFPVVFIDTGKLFGETRTYRDRLVDNLGLRNLQIIKPDPKALLRHDPKGLLFSKSPDSCCYWRKVEPLERALQGYDAWISGRKRFHGAARSDLKRFEAVDGRVKINPLAEWSRADLDRYFEKYALPRHPLENEGYLSIGCMPCTDRVAADGDPRSGRWAHAKKTECGIHFPVAEARRRAVI